MMRRAPVRKTNEVHPAGTWVQRFLDSRWAPLLTHLSLLALLIGEFALILRAPLWAAFLLCLAIHHRIGIVLHEYMHGIPLRRYRDNLRVFSAVNGLLMTFGLLEVFRGNHLAHHRWLNTEKDPGYWSEEALSLPRPAGGALKMLRGLLAGDHGPLMHGKLLYRAVSEYHPYVRPRRVVLEAALSLAWIAFWVAMGLPRVPGTLILLHVFVVPLGMFRGAMEHTSFRGDPGFANEYRVWIPMFNMNRHIHHHLDPACPWYRLRFCTGRPQSPIGYWSHWYRAFVQCEYFFMQPMERSAALPTYKRLRSGEMKRAPATARG